MSKPLRLALERIAEQQPKTLEMIRHNGFIFTDIGNEPGNWQHLAFSIYTDLCEIDAIARTALERTNDPERFVAVMRALSREERPRSRAAPGGFELRSRSGANPRARRGPFISLGTPSMGA